MYNDSVSVSKQEMFFALAVLRCKLVYGNSQIFS